MIFWKNEINLSQLTNHGAEIADDSTNSKRRYDPHLKNLTGSNIPAWTKTRDKVKVKNLIINEHKNEKHLA